MILYSEQYLSRCESFSRPPLPTHNRGAHFYTPSSVYRDASLSPILLDACFIFQQLEGMADDALPQTIRHALGTAFKKKPAATLDQWAALCAKAGMDDVDDVASCRAEDFDTWIGKDFIVLTNFLRRLHTPAQQCPQSPKRLATQDAAADSPSKKQKAQQQGTKRKAALPAIRNNHKIN